MDQPEPATVTAEELMLRLITSREYIDPVEGRRLLAEHRDQVITELDELIASKRNAVHAACGRQTADGMDRARTLVLAARTEQES